MGALRRWGRNSPILVALVLLLMWTLIVLLGGLLVLGSQTQDQIQAVSGVYLWQILAAALFLLGACAVLDWRGLGFQAAPVWQSVRLTWFPLLYPTVFLLAVLLTFPPAAGVMWVVAVNCLWVGLSEELMFRGVLHDALSRRLRFWPAILLGTVLFGAMHSLNALGTGHLTAALLQSVAACMTGLFLMGLRLRTGSLWPAILFHAFWDFALILAGVVAQSQSNGPPGASEVVTAQGGAVALLVMLPVGIYGFYLMRKGGRDQG